jgi:hypothetical protein
VSSLTLIAAEYRAAVAALADLDLDEQTLADTLESIGGDIELKAQSYGFLIRSLNAEADSCDEWAKQAKEQGAAKRTRAERVKQYLSEKLQECGIRRVEGPGITIGWRASHAIVIDEPGLIPAEYMRTPEPPPPAPDKTEIKAAIKCGEVVPGAHMETRQSLQIR